jgi:hypothetical protein
MATGSKVDDSQQGPVPPEVRLLLDVVSRLAPVNVVIDVSEGDPPISVCFEDRKALRAFTAVLRKFRGNFRWISVSRLPYVCVVPVAEQRGSEIPLPQIRRLAVQDIASLARFVEIELQLGGAPSHGVIVTQTAGHAGDIGPGGPALLVADPRQYLSNGFIPTSPRDKTVERWISDEEGDLMYDKLHPSDEIGSKPRDAALLERVCESKYEDLIILPLEVRTLREECQRMAYSWPDLRPALDRIARICDTALSGGLGIVVLGR